MLLLLRTRGGLRTAAALLDQAHGAAGLLRGGGDRRRWCAAFEPVCAVGVLAHGRPGRWPPDSGLIAGPFSVKLGCQNVGAPPCLTGSVATWRELGNACDHPRETHLSA